MLGDIDYYLRDSSRGFARIQNGEIPDGSGGPIPIPPEQGSLLDYLFLPGRVGGQRVHSVDANSSTVRIDASSLPAGVVGTFGTFSKPALSLYAADELIAGLGAIRFGTNCELAFVSPDSTGFGVGVWFPSADGTSAFRISSTTNRTFLQCGIVNSAGNVNNPSMTFGASGARVADSMAFEFLRLNLSSTQTTLADGSGSNIARTTRVGINIRPDEYASSTVANKAKSLHIGDHQLDNNTPTPTWPAADDPAPLIVENSGGVSGRALLTVNTNSTGTANAKVIGAAQIGFKATGALASDQQNGRLALYNNLSHVASITSNSIGGAPVAANGRIDFETVAATPILSFRYERFSTWADNVTTSLIEGNGTGTSAIMLTQHLGGPVSRLGIMATSTIMGPVTSLATMPAPLSSRILTVCNSAATVLSGLDSAGAYFLVSGGATGKLFVSDANGVGSWSATLSTDITFADTKNLILNTTTGSKIATGTTQKLGFWNAVPIVQPTTAGAAATRVGGGGTTLTDTDTFDGYTVAQVVKALRNTGLLA